jgi:hypothetical protein
MPRCRHLLLWSEVDLTVDHEMRPRLVAERELFRGFAREGDPITPFKYSHSLGSHSTVTSISSAK